MGRLLKTGWERKLKTQAWVWGTWEGEGWLLYITFFLSPFYFSVCLFFFPQLRTILLLPIADFWLDSSRARVRKINYVFTIVIAGGCRHWRGLFRGLGWLYCGCIVVICDVEWCWMIMNVTAWVWSYRSYRGETGAVGGNQVVNASQILTRNHIPDRLWEDQVTYSIAGSKRVD